MSGKHYEIGLTMAGNVSSGAYTAGVIDFLIEAMDSWEKAKIEEPTLVPSHSVKLRAITGASAGAMTSAIFSAVLNRKMDPVYCKRFDEKGPENNVLYDTWVKKVDAKRLLDSNDLDDDDNLKSLLNSAVLDDIAKSVIKKRGVHLGRVRSWVSNPLDVEFAVNNLRGVPYKVKFSGREDKWHNFLLHEDSLRFRVSSEDFKDDSSMWVDPVSTKAEALMKMLNAGMASGVFPVGLAPRMVECPSDIYNMKFDSEQIQPNWPGGVAEKMYKFLAVDGVGSNIEPFEMIRKYFAPNMASSGPYEASQSIIMINPFPGMDEVTVEDVEKYDELEVGELFNLLFCSTKNRCRYKLFNIKAAIDDNNFSQFLIAPMRKDQGVTADQPLASSLLGGFSGFLSQKFRYHDFMLGRKNCRSFLKKYFGIPLECISNNPIFNVNSKDVIEQYKYTHPTYDMEFFPIIPLVEEVEDREIPVPTWNSLKMNEDDISRLYEQLEDRLEPVMAHLAEKQAHGFLSKFFFKKVVGVFDDNVAKGICDLVKGKLKEFDLYEA